jgi:hypothetical protein
MYISDKNKGVVLATTRRSQIDMVAPYLNGIAPTRLVFKQTSENGKALGFHLHKFDKQMFTV